MIHFAGLKAVGESVGNPRRYFDNNLVGTINLYETMAKHNCKMVKDQNPFTCENVFSCSDLVTNIVLILKFILYTYTDGVFFVCYSLWPT